MMRVQNSNVCATSFGTYTDLLGRAWLYFNESRDVVDDSENMDSLVRNGSHVLHRRLVVVMIPRRAWDMVIQVLIHFFLIISTIGMGCKTDLLVVRDCLKKPIAPAIGFVSQYLAMPLIAFGVAKLVPLNNPAVAFGIFACGTCPGGGASNIYSFLLGGDLSLSVTMTTISTMAALGMVPLWLFTLGQQFHDDKIQITIPYTRIIRTLALIILPLFAGLIIKYKVERVAKIILKVIKPVTFVAVAVLISVAIYANLFIFRLFKPTTLIAGCMLPYIGYIVGGVIALVCRQSWTRVKTIAIETGVQNVFVAYLVLLVALPPPDGHLAAVGPAASGFMTPLPLFVLSIVYQSYLKWCKKTDKSTSAKPGVHELDIGIDRPEKEPLQNNDKVITKADEAGMENDTKAAMINYTSTA